MTSLVPARTDAYGSGVGNFAHEYLDLLDCYGKTDDVPNIIEFVTSPHYVNRPRLYPRQATLLKLIFLQTDLLTDYDDEVICGWIENFEQTGDNGLPPDLWQRIELCQKEGRPWFREIIAAIGRRGSKGYIGALAGAYVLWTYRAWADPQDHFGVDRDKRLTALVFGGKKEQAKANQWRDLVNVILGAPCFSPYISNPQTESLTLYARADFERIREMNLRGVKTEMDLASFEILPKESTAMAGRGPAAFIEMFDEMAHVVNTGANRDATEVYNAATPALDQFGEYAFLYEPSSTWQKAGKFYENYERALEVDEQTGDPIYHDLLMIQLTSWDPYIDYERATEIEMWPGGPRFAPIKNAIQRYDDQMQRLERANPQSFAVERRSRWAATLNAYLAEERVDYIFEPWQGDQLRMRHMGILAEDYKLHGDPSKSGANFGLAIAHSVPDPDGGEVPHVVFDYLHAWKPEDFEDNNYEVDYIFIEEELKGYLDRFMPSEATFDQWNSVGTIQRLRAYARAKRYPKRVTIDERTATKKQNWNVAETFKTAVGLGLVHAPYFELAELELKFLQDLGNERVDHPDTGPVQTKDVADCMMILTHALIGDHIAHLVAKLLGASQLGSAAPGGLPKSGEAGDINAAFSAATRGRVTPGFQTTSNRGARPRPAAKGYGSDFRRRDRRFGR